MQHALQKTEAALLTLNKAILANPKNPLCKFHRASMYFASDRHQEALKELEELKEIVPKESLVYFLIGKVLSLISCFVTITGVEFKSLDFFFPVRCTRGLVTRIWR